MFANHLYVIETFGGKHFSYSKSVNGLHLHKEKGRRSVGSYANERV